MNKPDRLLCIVQGNISKVAITGGRAVLNPKTEPHLLIHPKSHYKISSVKCTVYRESH